VPAPRLPTVPGYAVEELLGQGYSGQVFRARREATGEEVALKVFRAERCQGRQRRRLEREARTLKEHAHPCLVPLVDEQLQADPPYLAFRFMAGGDLSDKIGDGDHLSTDRALDVARRVVSALVHLHTRGIVHRDLKPANVLLDARGKAYLGDLGLVRGDDDLTLTTSGQMVGTWNYMAPEVQSGQPATVASDVYSYAALTVELVTGEAPTRTARGIEVPASLGTAGLPKELVRELRRALRTEPGDRPRDLSGMAAALGVG
jgi:serine/threonine-protein kinase